MTTTDDIAEVRSKVLISIYEKVYRKVQKGHYLNQRTKNDGIAYGKYLGIDELRRYMSLGEGTARKIGEEAQASIRFGRRVIYDREKIDEYMASLNTTERVR